MIQIKDTLRHLRDRSMQRIHRIPLRNMNFSIISNNCWGSFIYQRFGLPYMSPTAGLEIYLDEYFKFIENLSYYLTLKPEVISPADAPYYEFVKGRYGKDIDYPVAALDDITIWFIHYKTAEEALEKWERRKKRVNFDNLLVKWSQRYDQNPELLERFLASPYKNKIAFVQPDSPIHHPQAIKVPEIQQLNKTGGR